MANITNFLNSRQAAYERLPLPAKVLIVTLALITGVAGVLLTFTPLSDAGVALMLVSLGVLSFQYQWARRLLTYITDKLADKTFRRKLYVATGVVFALFIGLAVYLFATR